MTTPRTKPYLWSTWLAAALGGDDHCEFKVWHKSHFRDWPRLEEDDESKNRLATWRADHDRAVRARAALLRANGWAVSVEDENTLNVNGVHAVVGGKADIVALREGERARGIDLSGDLLAASGLALTDARIEDVKTGKRRESDWWQVAVYVMLMPMMQGRLKGCDVAGIVVYMDGQREIAAADLLAAKPRIAARIVEIATEPEPRKTPSQRECRFCDIADCDERAPDEAVAPVDTEEF